VNFYCTILHFWVYILSEINEKICNFAHKVIGVVSYPIEIDFSFQDKSPNVLKLSPRFGEA